MRISSSDENKIYQGTCELGCKQKDEGLKFSIREEKGIPHGLPSMPYSILHSSDFDSL